MKKILLLILILNCQLSIVNLANAQFESAPAFPGAEGFARLTTTGGRGGKVLHVTSLADDGSEGTFRWACLQKGARTIVFDVDGTIFLTSELKMKNGNVSILGQTAPGDGICIADYPFVISCDNVIIRFMRFRLGNREIAHHEGDGLGGMDNENIIIDHCSVSWSVDECLSVYGSKNLSVQWNIASQSMVNSGHKKGAHGYGGNWGGSGASYHHNLLAHHTSRCPRLGPRTSTQTDERVDLRNNVMYNWGGNGCYGGEGQKVNIVNNYYKPGPGTLTRSKQIQMRIASVGIRTSEYTHHGTAEPNKWDLMWHVWGKYYVNGNVNPLFPQVTKDNLKWGFLNQVNMQSVDGTYTAQTKDTIIIKEPIPYGNITTQTAEEAYDKVLAYAGASLHRDSNDQQVVEDVATGTAKYGKTIGKKKYSETITGWIDSQDEVGGWPELEKGTALPDSDGDGMPDAWEKAHGLNPNDAADGNAYTIDKRGFYTNAEVYFNSIVEPIIKAQNKNADTKVKGWFEEYFPVM